MPIRIANYADDLGEALAAFNARLAAAGRDVRFFPPRPAAAPPVFHQGLAVARYLAVEDDCRGLSVVRGGYALKFQEFWLGGEVLPVADFMLPVSEGIIRPEYALIAAILLRDALARQPFLYGLGMGGTDLVVARFLKAAGWQMFPVPFFFSVVRPVGFLRNIVHLRRSPLRRLALDAAAFSGAGWIAARGWDLLHARQSAIDRSLRAEIVTDFDAWSDEVWDTARPHYRMCAVRDAATLRKMYPRQAAGFQRLRFLRAEKPVGWALLLNSQLHGHSYFNNMRLGSLVDCLAEPQYAASIVRHARAILADQGVDLVISNQSHRAWRAALKSCGFMSGPSNFIFTSSPVLSREMEKRQIQPAEIHLNRGDGDGPINL
jgi:hypothetical protein